MATFDNLKWYDCAELSDVTIKFGDREVKAHKVVLARRSEWFRKAFKDTFLESAQKVVTLEEDEPVAVEAMLKYIYGCGCGYQETTDRQVAAHYGQRATPWYHISVFDVADKYLLPELAELAMAAMDPLLARIVIKGEGADVDRHGLSEVFELVKALAERVDTHPDVLDKAGELMEKHLPALCYSDEFREWLGERDNGWHSSALLQLPRKELR